MMNLTKILGLCLGLGIATAGCAKNDVYELDGETGKKCMVIARYDNGKKSLSIEPVDYNVNKIRLINKIASRSKMQHAFEAISKELRDGDDESILFKGHYVNAMQFEHKEPITDEDGSITYEGHYVMGKHFEFNEVEINGEVIKL